MKKNFFKKLSFVLALAMIISVLAPAAGAFAATAPKLNSTSKYLHLGDAKLGEFNFNINGTKQKGWKYAWTSSNTKVATVKSNGVTTAKAAGTTTVAVAIKEADGTKVVTLKAKVTVRDNIKELGIYMQTKDAPEVDKLLVDGEYDFGRTYKTNAGLTKGSKAVTRWTVDDTDNASIVDTSGVFTAKKAGEYKITARAFQSAAKYDEWKKDNTADVVTAKQDLTVTVIPSLVKTTQLTATKIEVQFDSVVKDVLKDFVVKNEAGIQQVIKEVKWNDAGNTATIELYISLSDGKAYVVSVADYQDTFVASVGVPAKVVITGPDKVQYGVAGTLTYKLYDAKDVEVTGSGSVEFEITNNVGWVFGTEITLFNINDVAGVKATYNTGTYNLETGNEIKITSEVYQVRAVESLAATTTDISAWTISNAATKETADYTNANHSITLSDTAGYKIFAKGKNSADADVYFTKFSSTNSGVLIVDLDGSVYPVAVGKVNVIAETADGFKKVLLVDVKAAKAASFVSLKGAYTAVLTNAIATDEAKFEIVIKDQYQGEMAAELVAVDQYAQPTGAGALDFDDTTDGTIVFNPTVNGGTKAPAGTYRFKLTTQDKTVVVSVLVKEPSTTIAYSKLTVDASSLDIAIANSTTTKPTITVYSRTYDNTGVANGVTSAAIKVTGPDNFIATGTTDGSGEFTFNAYTGVSLITPIKAGTYKVEGTTPGQFVAAYFAVTNSQVAPTLNVLGITISVSAAQDVKAAIMAASPALFTATSKSDATVAVTDMTLQSASISADFKFATPGVYQVLVKDIEVTETFTNGFSIVHNVGQRVITVTVN